MESPHVSMTVRQLNVISRPTFEHYLLQQVNQVDMIITFQLSYTAFTISSMNPWYIFFQHLTTFEVLLPALTCNQSKR